MNQEKLKLILEKVSGKATILFATKYLDKYQFVSFIRLAIELKISPLLIGENRVQDAKEKLDYLMETFPALRPCFKFVMIGNLQKNKINKALEIFDEIHSIDSVELAQELNKRISKSGWHERGTPEMSYIGRASTKVTKYTRLHFAMGLERISGHARSDRTRRLPIFLEVNLSGEPSKHGFKPEEIEPSLKYIESLKYLKIIGLMTMPPFTKNPEPSRPHFRRLKLLATHYKLQTSMGTSQDWKIALEEGTDIIRIGSGIFSS